MMSIKLLIAPAVISLSLWAVPSARASDSNLHCRPSAFDQKEAVFEIITDRSMGCRLADAWAGAWLAWDVQNGSGEVGTTIDDPAGNIRVLSFDYHGQYVGTFLATYRQFRGNGNPIDRVQARGMNRMFLSFVINQ